MDDPHGASSRVGDVLGVEVVGTLRRAGVTIAVDDVTVPLTGGVSSDIWRVDTATGPVCIKRALPKLRTAAEWTAPVSRSASEARWLRDAARVRPDLVPRVLAFVDGPGVLVLEYLDHSRWTQWKALLLAGRVEAAIAARLGGALGEVHRSMADAREDYPNDQLFAALRLEPYIRYTAQQHPSVGEHLARLDDEFVSAAGTVVHGDVSPKNVLVGSERVVLLDAECATWGDPAFDLGFFLTHLCAKAVHRPADATLLRACARAFLDGYAERSGGQFGGGPSERAGRWLAAILLARVDGRSPLEYLDEQARQNVRSRALDLLRHPASDVAAALEAWFSPVDRAGG